MLEQELGRSASASARQQAELDNTESSELDESNELNEALAILGSEPEPEVQPTVTNIEHCQPLLYRCFEVVLALGGLLVLSPLMAAIALILFSKRQGSVFYSQVRVGQGGRLFTIYKFRTMRVDAETNGPFICTTYEDPRITKI